MSEMTVDHCIS